MTYIEPLRILTFDLEDWFHLLDHPETADPSGWSKFESRFEKNLDKILELLQVRGARATFFALGWIAEKYPRALRTIAAAGHEIGSHSDVHSLVYNQTPRQFQTELGVSIAKLENATGKGIRSFRAPGFSINDDALWAFDILVQAGITHDCSVFPAARAHGGLPGFTSKVPHWIDTNSGSLKSFPINTRLIFGHHMVYSGGGYFRALPSWVIRQLVKEDHYVMTYFHPRDFDPDQPVMVKLSIGRKIKSYIGLSSAMTKLESLLNLGGFSDLASADEKVNWDTASRVSINKMVSDNAA